MLRPVTWVSTSGSTTSRPISLPATKSITTTGAMNDLRRKIRMSRNALSRRCRGICRRTNATRPARPTATGRYGGNRGVPGGRLADQGESIDQASEPERGQQQRRHVQGHRLRGGGVAQLPRAQHQGANRERQHQDEEPAPAQCVKHETGQRRPDRRCHGRDGRGDRHHPAAATGRDQAHGRGHQQGKEDGGAERLDDPAGHQDAERRRDGGTVVPMVNSDSATRKTVTHTQQTLTWL